MDMGAHIDGIGSNVMTVHGTTSLRGTTHSIAPDHIEIGSFMALAGVTGGELVVKDTVPEDLRMIRLVFDRLGLRSEVRAMRERMRRELSRGDAAHFDVKQDPGGIADIEFLAQYWALSWAREYPAVVMFADTIRQLESVASADLVPQSSVDVLTAAYRAYRGRAHRAPPWPGCAAGHADRAESRSPAG